MIMDKVSRIGVSLEPELLKQFDELIATKGYVSRSEAIRDLVRDSLAESDWKHDDMVMTGVIVIVFDAGINNVFERFEQVYRKWQDSIIFSNTINLDGINKLDTITVNGRLTDLKSILSDFLAIKGVRRGKLTMAAPNSGNLHHIGVRN